MTTAWTDAKGPMREVVECAVCGHVIVVAYDPARDRVKLVEIGGDREHDVTKCAQKRAN